MTERLYYEDPYIKRFEAKVISCAENKGKYETVLDRTAFYPEGGGQPGDRGSIDGAIVSDTRVSGEDVVHIADRFLKEGSTVSCEIDWLRRFDLMQQHSGEHIVSGLLHGHTGCENVGFHLGSDVITIDFDKEISEELLFTVEREANEIIWEDIPIEITHPSPEELGKIPYRSKKELTGDVRIVTVPKADICACCGTHVLRTGEIGLIKILSMRKLREGVRIEMVSGARAYDFVAEIFAQNRRISNLLSAKPKETALAAERLLSESEELKRRLTEAEMRRISAVAADYEGRDGALIFEPDLTGDGIRRLCDAVGGKITGNAAVFCGSDSEGYKYAVMIKEGFAAFIREMNSALRGRGGGRDGLAQGSVSASREEIEAFFAVR